MSMKFLVDSMLGKLARFLRIFGYDTVYAEDLITHYAMDPVPDELLEKYAQEDVRIIITKDASFHKRSKVKTILLTGEGVYNYLNQLKTELGLNFEFKMDLARCSKCNAPLHMVNDKLEIIDQVESSTFRNYNVFYQCTNINCNKIFWNGPHIGDITFKISKYVHTD
jgi:uncharacterized protein with PIN domain